MVHEDETNVAAFYFGFDKRESNSKIFKVLKRYFNICYMSEKLRKNPKKQTLCEI